MNCIFKSRVDFEERRWLSKSEEHFPSARWFSKREKYFPRARWILKSEVDLQERARTLSYCLLARLVRAAAGVREVGKRTSTDNVLESKFDSRATKWSSLLVPDNGFPLARRLLLLLILPDDDS